MDRNTYRVFDYVLEHPKPDLHLCVTSNFSVEDALWQRYKGYVRQLCDRDRIEHFMQYVSVDGWGQRAEYMRHGLDFDLLWSRVNEFLEENPYVNSLTFIITMNNLSVTSLKELFQGILDLRRKYTKTYQKIWFDTPVLRQPTWQSLQILPESYARILENISVWMQDNKDADHGFRDFEVQRLQRDIAWMRRDQSHDHRQARADFYRFFAEHDRRRDTDFIATFPEMRAWWQECLGHAQRS